MKLQGRDRITDVEYAREADRQHDRPTTRSWRLILVVIKPLRYFLTSKKTSAREQYQLRKIVMHARFVCAYDVGSSTNQRWWFDARDGGDSPLRRLG